MASPTETEYDDGNIFAKILSGDIPCHKVYEDEVAIAFMDIMPQGDGHTLVVPKAASRNLLDADSDTLRDVLPVVQKMARAVKRAFDADGITIMQFNEGAAGQTVFHLHFHIIPRFDGAALKGHTGDMADQGRLAQHAERIRASIE